VTAPLPPPERPHSHVRPLSNSDYSPSTCFLKIKPSTLPIEIAMITLQPSDGIDYEESEYSHSTQNQNWLNTIFFPRGFNYGYRHSQMV